MPSILFHTTEDRLGDALIKLPAILALKKLRPDIHLIWSSGEKSSAYKHGLAPLVEGVLDEIHEFSDLGNSWLQMLRSPCARYFDCIIVSERKLRATLALRRIPHSIFIAPMRNFLLSDRKPLEPQPKAPAYRQIQTLFELAIDHPLTLPTELSLPDRYLELAAHRLPSGPRYIGFAPGAGGQEKCWPLANYLEVARAQLSRDRIPVFFLGPEERDWRGDLARSIPSALFPEYAANGQTLGGPPLTIALARRLHASVSSDSGAGHLLAAGGRTCLSLFGRTDARKFEPPFGIRKAILARDFGSTTVSAIPVRYVIEVLDDVCR